MDKFSLLKMNLLTHFLKTKQISVSRGASFKGITLLISYPLSISIIFVLKMTNLAQGT